MKSEFESFVNELYNKITGLNEFNSVVIGTKPQINSRYICLIVPVEARAEHSAPQSIVWHFEVRVYVFKHGSGLWDALDGIDKIIKALEADLHVNNSVDTVTYSRIAIENLEERSGAALEIIGMKLVKEV